MTLGGGGGPTSEKFRDVREELDRFIRTLRGTADALGRLASSATSSGASGSGSSSSSGGGLQEQDQQVKDLARSFKDLNSALKQGASATKGLGLKDVSRELDQVSKKFDLVAAAVQGITASVRILASTWKPVTAGITLALGALLGVQKVFEATTGLSLTLKETVQVMGLSLVKSFADAKAAYLLFKETITGESLGAAVSGDFQKVMANVNQLLAAARSGKETGDAAQATIDEIVAEAQKRGSLSTKDLVVGIFNDIVTELKPLLGDVGNETAVRMKEIVRPDITAFTEFNNRLVEMQDLVQGTFDFIVSGVQQVSATISDALLDAFLDPQADIRDSFAQLFRAIAQQLLQLLIQATILKIASGFVAPGAQQVTDSSGAVVGTGFSAAQGGPVPRGDGSPHRRARGFAQGGPPSGVPISDTIAAWLTPGEYVLPKAAAAAYAPILEGLRSLAIPPDLLANLAAPFLGGFSVPQAVRIAGPQSFAGGGPVGSGGSGGGGPAAVGVLAVNQQTARAIFDAGPGELERALGKNPGRFRSALGL